MSLTFLAKSSANSWKMSLAGHVLCQRIVVGLAWPFAIIGKASVPAVAAAAPDRNLRRVGAESFFFRKSIDASPWSGCDQVAAVFENSFLSVTRLVALQSPWCGKDQSAERCRGKVFY